MTAEFFSRLEQALQRSAGPKRSSAKHRRAIVEAGIDSEAKLLQAVSAKGARTHLLEIIAWLLPRWPGGTRNAAFLTAERVLLGHAAWKVRAEAAVALGLLESSKAPGLLVGALADAEPEVRARALAGLALHGDVKTLPAVVALLARAPEASMRAGAADALSGFRALAAERALIAALSDPSPEVRSAAAHSLGELRAKGAMPSLRTLATGDRSARARAAARSALARLQR